ncbi:MAG: PilZ domain-containing protein [Acidobacteria bacterium]|nr:PilZ domain-containing protein [Acidobacteriota bacterium]
MNKERRKYSRLRDPLPVVVRSINRREKPFQFNSITQDIGAGGLCAVAPRLLRLGEKINLHIRFAVPGSNPPQAPSASARAVVLRTEKRPDGTCVFAASFLFRHTH